MTRATLGVDGETKRLPRAPFAADAGGGQCTATEAVESGERTAMMKNPDRWIAGAGGLVSLVTLLSLWFSGVWHLGNRLGAVEARIDGAERRLEAGIDGVEQRLDAGLDAVKQRLDGVDVRLNGVDVRLDDVNRRLDGVDARLLSIEEALRGRGPVSAAGTATSP